MSTPISVFDATGQILLSAELSEATLTHYQEQYAGFTIAQLSDPQADYVLDGAITPRPANPATLGGTTLSSLPTPCTITINGRQYVCTDDHAELELMYPGTYKITVSAFPFLGAEFEVTV